MRTHRPGSIRSRFVVAAAITASTLGVGACAGPAATSGAAASTAPVTPITTSTAPVTPATTSTAPVTAAAAAHSPPVAAASSPRGCAPIRPGTGHYEAGRVATPELRTPVSGCTSISVSNIVDPANPSDRCQTFLVGLWPLVNGSLTYTEPVTACGAKRTVLARNVPDNQKFLVLYDIDYLDPEIQTVKFKVWR